MPNLHITDMGAIALTVVVLACGLCFVTGYVTACLQRGGGIADVLDEYEAEPRGEDES